MFFFWKLFLRDTHKMAPQNNSINESTTVKSHEHDADSITVLLLLIGRLTHWTKFEFGRPAKKRKMNVHIQFVNFPLSVKISNNCWYTDLVIPVQFSLCYVNAMTALPQLGSLGAPGRKIWLKSLRIGVPCIFIIITVYSCYRPEIVKRNFRALKLKQKGIN